MKTEILGIKNYPENTITLIYGKKKRMFKVDLVEIISFATKESKSQVKRNIKSGALEMLIPKQ